MNIYQFKRDPLQVSPKEYSGFIVRAQNEEAAETLIGENYKMEYNGSNYNNESYHQEFEVKLIASGVVGEPEILSADFKPKENKPSFEDFEIDILDKLLTDKFENVGNIKTTDDENYFKQVAVLMTLNDIRYKLEEMRNLK